jgi:hypothetical protein
MPKACHGKRRHVSIPIGFIGSAESKVPYTGTGDSTYGVAAVGHVKRAGVGAGVGGGALEPPTKATRPTA